MITYKDIRIAINQQLAKTGIEINARDVQEGFNRPSFFVQLTNNTRSGYEEQVHRSTTVQIYYFPSDRYEYSIEVLDIQETLEELFDLKLRVKDRFINIDELECGLTDGVLNCSFDLEFYDARDSKYNTIIIDDDRGEPIEVPLDENGNPITDKDGKPIPIELMKELYIRGSERNGIT